MYVFVWVVGSCLAVSGLEVLIRIYVYETIILYIVESLASVLCCRVGQEGRPRYFPIIIMDHKPCCSVRGCIRIPHRAAVFEVWSD